MSEPFYRERMAHHGVTTVVPQADERNIVNDAIYDELVRGHISDKS